MSPDRVAERDVLTITGEGFVVGAEALVKFSGVVHRPAQPARKVNVEQRGVAVDAESIELQVSPDLVAQFCGPHRATTSEHATFRGDVRVAFVPRVPGAPPIEGRARDLVLDVFQSEEHTPLPVGAIKVGISGQPILAFLGLNVAELGEQGLRVIEAAPGKPASGAGIRTGDRIVGWGGLRVHRIYDLEPFPGQRLVTVNLLRDGVATEFPVVVAVEGYAPQSAHGWWVGVVLIGALVVTVVLSRSAASRWLVWLAVAGARRGRKHVGASAAFHRFAVAPFLIVSAVFLGLASQRRLLPDELDLVWVMLVVSVALALFGVGAARRKQRFSLLSLVSVWIRQVPLHVALWTLLLVVVLEHGRASVWELASPQTVDPRSFGAFVSPSSFLVAGALALAAGAVSLCNYAPESDVSNRFWSKVNIASRSFGDLAALLLGAILVAVFFGGWSLRFEAAGALSVSEALGFQARFTLFYAGFLALRRGIPEIPVESFEQFGLRWLLPASASALAVLPVWGADIWPNWMRTATQALLLCVTSLVLVGVPITWLALRRLGASKLRASGLNPWI